MSHVFPPFSAFFFFFLNGVDCKVGGCCPPPPPPPPPPLCSFPPPNPGSGRQHESVLSWSSLPWLPGDLNGVGAPCKKKKKKLSKGLCRGLASLLFIENNCTLSLMAAEEVEREREKSLRGGNSCGSGSQTGVRGGGEGGEGSL